MIFPTSPGGICIPFPGGVSPGDELRLKVLIPVSMGAQKDSVGVVVCIVPLEFTLYTTFAAGFFGHVFFSRSPACITNIFVMNSPNHSNESESNRSRPSVLQKEIPAIFAHLPGFSSHKMNEHLLSRGAKSQNLHSLGFFSALVADSVGHAMAPSVGVI